MIESILGTLQSAAWAASAGWFSLLGVYAFCLVLGLGYVIIAAVLGGLGGEAGGHDFGHVGDLGHDVDFGHGAESAGHEAAAAGHHGQAAGGAHLGPFSPLIVALFLTCFGGAGLLFSTVVDLGRLSLLPAAGSSLAFAAAALWAFNHLFAHIEASSQARACDLVGRRTAVITPIPKGPGAGAVAFVVNGARYTLTARSEDAVSMDRGADAIILRVVGQSCFVAPPDDPRSAKAAQRRADLEEAAARKA